MRGKRVPGRRPEENLCIAGVVILEKDCKKERGVLIPKETPPYLPNANANASPIHTP
jgi:hypothetical protein